LCCLWDKKETPGRGNETNSRNIEKTQKRCKKVLTEGWGCGIILERQGPPERMTSESGRSKAKRTNMDTLKNEPQVRKDRKASEKVLDKKSLLW